MMVTIFDVFLVAFSIFNLPSCPTQSQRYSPVPLAAHISQRRLNTTMSCTTQAWSKVFG